MGILPSPPHPASPEDDARSASRQQPPWSCSAGQSHRGGGLGRRRLLLLADPSGAGLQQLTSCWRWGPPSAAAGEVEAKEAPPSSWKASGLSSSALTARRRARLALRSWRPEELHRRAAQARSGTRESSRPVGAWGPRRGSSAGRVGGVWGSECVRAAAAHSTSSGKWAVARRPGSPQHPPNLPARRLLLSLKMLGLCCVRERGGALAAEEDLKGQSLEHLGYQLRTGFFGVFFWKGSWAIFRHDNVTPLPRLIFSI